MELWRNLIDPAGRQGATPCLFPSAQSSRLDRREPVHGGGLDLAKRCSMGCSPTSSSDRAVSDCSVQANFARLLEAQHDTIRCGSRNHHAVSSFSESPTHQHTHRHRSAVANGRMTGIPPCTIQVNRFSRDFSFREATKRSSEEVRSCDAHPSHRPCTARCQPHFASSTTGLRSCKSGRYTCGARAAPGDRCGLRQGHVERRTQLSKYCVAL